jgi:hypothetical protein
MTMPQDVRPARYRVAKLVKWAQRMTVHVAFGCALIVGSHWWPDEGERAFLRDTGAVIVGFSVVRWRAAQGHRRIHPETGRPLRTPTVRISSEEIERFWKKRR